MLEFCKPSLMGAIGQSSEDQNTDERKKSKEHPQGFSVRNKHSTGNGVTAHVCYAQAENLSVLCSHCETLQKTKIKGSGLVPLVDSRFL